MSRKIAVIIMLALIMMNLLGCSWQDDKDENANLQTQDNVTTSRNEDEIGETHNWEGKIKEIKKHDTQEGYSMIVWDGLESSGSFIIEDALVYGKYHLQAGEYIRVVAQNIPHGLKILNIDKIEERTAIRGIIKEIEIENEISRIYLKVSDKEMFNREITIEIDNDTRFVNATIESLKKADLIRVKGVLKDSTIKSDEVELISALNFK